MTWADYLISWKFSAQLAHASQNKGWKISSWIAAHWTKKNSFRSVANQYFTSIKSSISFDYANFLLVKCESWFWTVSVFFAVSGRKDLQSCFHTSLPEIDYNRSKNVRFEYKTTSDDFIALKLCKMFRSYQSGGLKLPTIMYIYLVTAKSLFYGCKAFSVFLVECRGEHWAHMYRFGPFGGWSFFLHISYNNAHVL